MRRKWWIPLGLVGAMLVAGPAVALLEIPGERAVKEAFGVQYYRACQPEAARASEWRPAPKLPIPLTEARVAQVDGDVYILGGIDQRGDTTPVMLRHDPGTGRYEELPPLPLVRNHIGLAFAGGYLYVSGGVDDDPDFEGTDSFLRYSLSERRWEELPPMPTPRGGHAMVWTGSELLAIGGRDRDRSFDVVEAFDPRTGRWSERPPMPTRRDHLTAEVVDGAVYAIGGRRLEGESIPAVERYLPSERRWEQLPEQPEAISAHAMSIADGGRLILTGGENLGRFQTATNRTWSFEPATGRWSELPRLPTSRHGHVSWIAGGEAFVAGGATCAGPGHSDRVDSVELPAG